MMHAFEILSQGCSAFAFYRQLAMDTGLAFFQDQMMLVVRARLVEWINE
jgi:hypothetical protein